jgi:hypothetical protein
MTSRELETTSSERVISMWNIKLRNHKYSYFQSCCVSDSYYAVDQGCANNECQVGEATKFCVMTPNICGSSGWNLLYVTFWHLEFYVDAILMKNLCTPAVDIIS